MDPSRKAAEALETIAKDVAEKYGPGVVLAAMRSVLREHLTPEGAAEAERAADELWEDLKRGG